jgi:hypothetical protein
VRLLLDNEMQYHERDLDRKKHVGILGSFLVATGSEVGYTRSIYVHISYAR